jgi:membrane protease YdiL (CAAX protease family)
MFRSAATRQAATYVALVYAIVVGIALALPHAGFTPLLTLLTPVVVVCLITIFWTPRGQRQALWGSFGLRHLGVRSWPAAFILPVVFLAIGYGTAAMLGIATFNSLSPSIVVWLNWTLNLLVNLVIMTVLVLAEEIGWRGYLLPRLQILDTRRRAAVLTGFIHGVFHLPLILLTTTYDSVGNRYIVGSIVVATITAAGVFYAWLKDRSGTVWPVALAHGTVNAVFAIGSAAVITTSPVALAYTAGESGVVTLIAVAACAVVLLVRATTWHQPTTASVSRTQTPAPASAR